MTYRRFDYAKGRWRGHLSMAGWAVFYELDEVIRQESMKAVAATQEQAEAYVKAKTDSLARGEPGNKYIPVTESATGRLDVDQRPEDIRSGRAFKTKRV